MDRLTWRAVLRTSLAALAIGVSVGLRGTANARGLSTPPDGWKCANEVYGDGVCDCGCGAWDVDCEEPRRISGNVTLNCENPEETAHSCERHSGDQDNNVVVTNPSCWCRKETDSCAEFDITMPTPQPTAYPTLFPTGKPTTNPTPKPTEQPSSSPTKKPTVKPTAFPTTKPIIAPPKGWNCTAMQYNDENCDCGCGAPDPMCERHYEDLICSGKASDADLFCNKVTLVCQPKNIPEEWKCEESEWYDGVCDCGCGAPDPDCSPEKRAQRDGVSGDRVISLACNPHSGVHHDCEPQVPEYGGDGMDSGELSGNCWCRPDNFLCQEWPMGETPPPYQSRAPTSSPTRKPTTEAPTLSPTTKAPVLSPSPAPVSPAKEEDNPPVVAIAAGVSVLIVLGAVAMLALWLRKTKNAKTYEMADQEVELNSVSQPSRPLHVALS